MKLGAVALRCLMHADPVCARGEVHNIARFCIHTPCQRINKHILYVMNDDRSMSRHCPCAMDFPLRIRGVRTRPTTP